MSPQPRKYAEYLNMQPCRSTNDWAEQKQCRFVLNGLFGAFFNWGIYSQRYLCSNQCRMEVKGTKYINLSEINNSTSATETTRISNLWNDFILYKMLLGGRGAQI